MKRRKPPLKAQDRLLEIRRCCGLVQSVMFAGATENYHRIHWDREYAVVEGLSCPIVNSGLLGAWFEQLIEHHYGPGTTWHNLAFTFKEPIPIGAEVFCGGRITAAVPRQEVVVLDLELWIRGLAGTEHTTARATVEVPR
jgi:acyl dehydratase